MFSFWWGRSGQMAAFLLCPHMVERQKASFLVSLSLSSYEGISSTESGLHPYETHLTWIGSLKDLSSRPSCWGWGLEFCQSLLRLLWQDTVDWGAHTTEVDFSKSGDQGAAWSGSWWGPSSWLSFHGLISDVHAERERSLVPSFCRGTNPIMRALPLNTIPRGQEFQHMHFGGTSFSPWHQVIV